MDIDSRRTKATLFIGIAVFALVGLGSTATSSDNQLTLYNGDLNVNGGDIVDDGTTVWDSSNGYVPSNALDGSGLTWADLGISQGDVSASDVGLGNVRNVDLSNTAGTFLNYDGSDDNYELDSTYFVESNSLIGGERALQQHYTQILANDNTKTSNFKGDPATGHLYITAENEDSDNNLVALTSNGNIELVSDADGDNSGAYKYEVTESGDWEGPGSKNWVHDLGNGSEAVYTSQESGEVRAVYEGKTEVDGETRVDLPSHLSKTVSDSEPKLRATATVQGELAYAAVIEKTDDYIVLDSSEPATVNYRITGVREGYEDKQVVRPKEE